MNLDELERLEREATPGPWISDDGIVTSDTRVICKEPPFVRGGSSKIVAPNVHRDEDADFIAALRNAASELIADARLAQKYKGSLTAIVQWLEKNQPDVFSRGLWDALEHASIDAALARKQK